MPEQFRATVEPVIPAIVDGFTPPSPSGLGRRTWATFVVGIATALLTALLLLVLKVGEREETAARTLEPALE